MVYERMPIWAILCCVFFAVGMVALLILAANHDRAVSESAQMNDFIEHCHHNLNGALVVSEDWRTVECRPLRVLKKVTT